MNRKLRWVHRVFARFMVAGGFTRAIDASVADPDTTWHMTMLAMAHLSVPAPHLVPSWPEQNG